MNRPIQTSIAAVMTLASACAFAAPAAPALTLPNKPVLTLAAAHRVADAAIADAQRLGTPGGVAVVDDGGHLLVFERMDGASIASAKIAPDKARTSALFRAPSKNFENALNGGRPALTTSGLNMMSGGEPIVVSGQVIGAVGVSTSSPVNDDPIAVTGSHALDSAR